MSDPEIVIENADVEISDAAIEAIAAMLLAASDADLEMDGEIKRDHSG